MNTVMSYKQWMKESKGNITKPRSVALKVVDSALAAFDKAKSKTKQDAVIKALVAWQISEGNQWKTSTRNKTNAVENLYRQLTGMGVVLIKLPYHIFAMSHELLLPRFFRIGD